jgi:hypothetical protein
MRVGPLPHLSPLLPPLNLSIPVSVRLLYVYFAVIMLTISSLIYGMMLCFIWAEKANDYVDAYLVSTITYARFARPLHA